MITIQIELYAFAELNEYAKTAAIKNNVYVNVRNEWWEGVYDDGSTIGFLIDEFDIDGRCYCQGRFATDASTCTDLIFQHHGKMTATYKNALEFDQKTKSFTQTWLKEEQKDEDLYVAAIENFENAFLNALQRDYLRMLQMDYAYLISTDAVADTLNSYQYWFTENGENATHVERMGKVNGKR